MHSHLLFKVCLGVGFAVGLACYCISWARGRTQFRLEHFLEVPGCGCFIVAGLHLLVCAYLPEQLVTIVVPRDSPPFTMPPGGYMELDDLHFVHLLIGGLATIAGGAYGIYRACR